MKIKVIIVSFFVFFTLIIHPYAIAGLENLMAEAYIQHLKTELNLTDDQVKSIRPIEVEYFSKINNIKLEEMDGKDRYDQKEQLDQENREQLSQILTNDQMNIQQREQTQMKISENEASTKLILQAISAACINYANAHDGKYPLDSASLTKAVPPYINADYCDEAKSGYTFVCSFSSNGYMIQAKPVTEGSSRTTIYTIKTGGVLTP